MQRTRKADRAAELEAELAGTPLPSALIYLWKTYNRLRRRQGSSGFGPLPIGWPEIDAFVRNSKFALAPWEIEIIEEIDDLYMTEQARSQRENMKTEKRED